MVGSRWKVLVFVIVLIYECYDSLYYPDGIGRVTVLGTFVLNKKNVRTSFCTTLWLIEHFR